MRRRATCCTSTSRSSAASSGPSHRVTGNRTRHRRRCRLGVSVRGRRRPRAHRLHRPCTRMKRKGSAVAVPAQRRGLLRQRSASRSERCSPTTARPSAPRRFAEACNELGISHSVHPALPTPDQRQGRALHPVGPARVGLRLHLPALERAHRHASIAGRITTTGTARIRASAASHPSVQTQLVRKQPLDASHLARRAVAEHADVAQVLATLARHVVDLGPRALVDQDRGRIRAAWPRAACRT